ncbi:hypothetical protein V6Z11_A05G408400 [Gossypium hirsutum]
MERRTPTMRPQGNSGGVRRVKEAWWRAATAPWGLGFCLLFGL